MIFHSYVSLPDGEPHFFFWCNKQQYKKNGQRWDENVHQFPGSAADVFLVMASKKSKRPRHFLGKSHTQPLDGRLVSTKSHISPGEGLVKSPLSSGCSPFFSCIPNLSSAQPPIGLPSVA